MRRLIVFLVMFLGVSLISVPSANASWDSAYLERGVICHEGGHAWGGIYDHLGSKSCLYWHVDGSVTNHPGWFGKYNVNHPNSTWVTVYPMPKYIIYVADHTSKRHWPVWKAARDWSYHTKLDVRVRSSCHSGYPCVRVWGGNFGDTGWSGKTYYTSTSVRDVYLNTYYVG